jgi:hypothetical protein
LGLVFPVRNRSAELDVLPELVVDGLGRADARALLGSAIGGPIAARAEREVRATGANARKRTVEISDGCRSRSSSPAPRRNVHVRVASDGDGLGHLST